MVKARLLIGLLGLVSLPLSVWSQEVSVSKSLCKQYFGVLWQDEKIPGGFMLRLSKE